MGIYGVSAGGVFPAGTARRRKAVFLLLWFHAYYLLWGEPCDVCFSVVVTAHDDTALPGYFLDPFPQSQLMPTPGE